MSSTCCDGYDPAVGLESCGAYRSVCAVLPANMLAYDLVLNGVTRRAVPTNLPYSNGAPPEINIFTLPELIANRGADLPNAACGPALRLTNSAARQSGAAWYRRKVFFYVYLYIYYLLDTVVLVLALKSEILEENVGTR